MTGADRGEVDLTYWAPVEPHAVAAWFAGIAVPWWIAGGWAIDLFLERQTRRHVDLDVGILRRDVQQVLPARSGWEVFEAVNGSLIRLVANAIPRATVNCLWCRQTSSGPWLLELMLNDSDEEDWVYRRERRIRRKLADVVRADQRGIPYLAPEVQLLFKSKRVRPKDDMDFQAVIPHLSVEAGAWLRRGLTYTSPSHDWVAQLTRLKA